MDIQAHCDTELKQLKEEFFGGILGNKRNVGKRTRAKEGVAELVRENVYLCKSPNNER